MIKKRKYNKNPKTLKSEKKYKCEIEFSLERDKKAFKKQYNLKGYIS
jgi:hypothetical protein